MNIIITKYTCQSWYIPDEDIKDVTIEEGSKETEDGVVDPAPALTSSTEIFVTRMLIVLIMNLNQANLYG